MSESGIPNHEPTITLHEALRLIVERRHPDGPEAAQRTLFALREPIPPSWFIRPSEYLPPGVEPDDVDAFNQEACRGLGAAMTILAEAIGKGDVRVVGPRERVDWSDCRIELRDRAPRPAFVILTISGEDHPAARGTARVVASDVERLAAGKGAAPPKAPLQVKHDEGPQIQRAKRILGEIFPDGVPDRSVLSHTRLVLIVLDRPDCKGRDAISRDTILRAAGRRKI